MCLLRCFVQEVLSKSEEDTLAIAAKVARQVPLGVTLALCGELGAGKTVFSRGFVHALPGGEGLRVKSPTFALARTYATKPPVHHMDLYRLEHLSALDELGLSEMLSDDEAYCLAEWGDRFGEAISSALVTVRFEDLGPEARKIVFSSAQINVDEWDLAPKR